MNQKHPSSEAFIGSVAVAVPPFAVEQDFAREFMTAHFGHQVSPRNLKLMQQVFSHPSIARRNFAFTDPSCLIREDPDERIRRFTHWAVTLAAEAAAKSLEQAGLSPDDVSGLVVNTCTGYLCPGLSSYLIERLGLPHTVRAYDLVGSGCGGAVPNLQIAGSQTTGHDTVLLSVSVEICSATFQMGDDLGLILSNALFGDGAAAAVIWGRPEGLELVASASYFIPEERDHIRYVHKNGQLHNRITTRLPRLVTKAVSRVVEDLLAPRGLRLDDIHHWAIHNGGEKIIDGIRDTLRLPEEKMEHTRRVLSRHGNMSSPTVWFVLKEIIESGIAPMEWCIMVAFGAGLSAHGYLLRKR